MQRSTRSRPGRAQRGVTLIELMIVLLIVGLLASIAVPSYRQYILRSHRVEAQTVLMNLAAAQEKHYLVCNTFTDAIDGASDAACDDGRGLGLGDFDAGVNDLQTENGWYTVTIDDADVETFTATATAIGRQADDVDCTTFSIDAAGRREAESEECWN
jgi:type IV pilus assembly protein PilE